MSSAQQSGRTVSAYAPVHICIAYSHQLEQKSRELEAARARIAESETGLAEMAALRSERESIRGRVSDMLEQLEGLSL